MSIFALGVLMGLAFVALLVIGRTQIAKGVNAQVANGAVAMVLAVIVGIFFLGALLSA